MIKHPARIKLGAGGERFGKSELAAMYAYVRHMCDRFFDMQQGKFNKSYLYWLIGEDYAMCRGEFDHLVNFFQTIDDVEYLSQPKQDSCILVTKTGARFETKSAYDERKLGVSAPDGVLGCEVGLWSDETWHRARGRMAEKRAWGIFTGSFENSLSSFAARFEEGQKDNEHDMVSFSLPTWANTAVFPGGWDDPEIAALRAFFPEERFNERFGGKPSKPSGLVFKLFGPEHVGAAEFDPERPVQLWVDPGYAHAYAVLAVQLYPDAVNIFDELYLTGRTHSQLIKECKLRRWWKQVDKVVMDRAGRQQNANGESGAEVWRKEADKRVATNYVHIKDGIDRVNTFLMPTEQTGLPRLVVSPRCVGLLAEMGYGRAPSGFPGFRPYAYRLTSSGGVTVSDLPIDAYNDACKALGYGLIENFGFTLEGRAILPPQSYLDSAVRRERVENPEKLSHADAWLRDLTLNFDTYQPKGLWS